MIKAIMIWQLSSSKWQQVKTSFCNILFFPFKLPYLLLRFYKIEYILFTLTQVHFKILLAKKRKELKSILCEF